MYRVLFPEGQLECADYERTENGVDLLDDAGEPVAFVPYANLHAVIDDAGFDDDEAEPSVV
jgi:hypothetical protein